MQNQVSTLNRENISQISILHKEALRIARELRRNEYLMIEVLQKIDHHKIYRYMGFKSLFQYAVHGLKLSENRAYNFILVSRKASKIDRLQQALREREISLSQARRLSAVVTKTNTEEWIKKAKTLTQRGLERAVAKENPKTLIQEGTRFISENILELKAALGTDTERLVSRVQDLLSQSLGRAASWDETLKAMAKVYIERKDPVVKASRCLRKSIKDQIQAENKEKSHERTLPIAKEDRPDETRAQSHVAPKNLAPRQAFSRTRVVVRTPASAQLKHQVNFRDKGRCRIEGCEDSRWTDIHHLIPVHKGGPNTLENLITLCRSHHQMEHTFGGVIPKKPTTTYSD